MFVYDAEAFVEAMQRVRGGAALSLPSFHHGTGDPVEAGVLLLESHTIVVVEGNYVLLGEPRCSPPRCTHCAVLRCASSDLLFCKLAASAAGRKLSAGHFSV